MKKNNSSLKTKASFNNRKDEIHSKAAMLFARDGYLSTTMEQVAKEVNLKKGGLYHYVKDKETLLFEILDKALDNFLERISNLPVDEFSPPGKLDILIREYTRSLVSHFDEITLLVLASKFLKPDLRAIIHSKQVRYENIFYSAISEGQSKGFFSNQVEPETLGFLIGGGIFNYYLWHPSELATDPGEKIAKFSSFFLGGMLARKVFSE